MALPRRRQADHATSGRGGIGGGGGAGGGAGINSRLGLRSSFSALAIILSLIAVANVMIYYGTGKSMISAGNINTEDLTVLNLARSMSDYAYGIGGDETQVCMCIY